MMSEELFLNYGDEKDLHRVAAILFPALGFHDYRERDSCHYVDDTYFKAKNEEITLKFFVCDFEEYADFRFTLVVLGKADLYDDDWLLSQVERRIVSILKPLGFEVVRGFLSDENFGERVKY